VSGNSDIDSHQSLGVRGRHYHLCFEVLGAIQRIMLCGCCGWAMGTTTVSSTGLYCRCRRRIMYGKEVCGIKKHLRADLVEPLV
jgi:hypothetical protein